MTTYFAHCKDRYKSKNDLVHEKIYKYKRMHPAATWSDIYNNIPSNFKNPILMCNEYSARMGKFGMKLRSITPVKTLSKLLPADAIVLARFYAGIEKLARFVNSKFRNQFDTLDLYQEGIIAAASIVSARDQSEGNLDKMVRREAYCGMLKYCVDWLGLRNKNRIRFLGETELLASTADIDNCIRRDFVGYLLDGFSHVDRYIVTAHIIEGEMNIDIAKTIGMTASAVNKSVSKCVRIMRERAKAEYKTPRV